MEDIVERARERLGKVTPRTFFNVRIMGFALIRAWVYLLFMGAAASLISWNGSGIPDYVFYSSAGSLCVTLTGAAIAHDAFIKLAEKNTVKATATCMACVGTLFAVISSIDQTPSLLFGIAGGLLTGVGSGFITLGYGEAYRSVAMEESCFEIPFAFFIAGAVFFLICALPPIESCIVCMCLPAISGGILFGWLGIWKPENRPAFETLKVDIKRFAFRIGLCSCLVGMADSVVRTVFMNASSTSGADFFCIPMLLASLLAIVIIYPCVLLVESDGWRQVYRAVMIVMALFTMLMPVLVDQPFWECVLALAGYGTFNALIWMILAMLSNRFKLSAAMVFGLGWGTITLGVLLGSAIGSIVCATFAPFTPQTLSLVTFLGTLCIMVSYMVIFKENDLLDMIRNSGDETQDRAQTTTYEGLCAKAAQEYGLTPKETEIMTLFAKGRSSKRIQEELYLSRGTVTTHLRHIYQKMDIHSKQELIDIIESEGKFPA